MRNIITASCLITLFAVLSLMFSCAPKQKQADMPEDKGAEQVEETITVEEETVVVEEKIIKLGYFPVLHHLPLFVAQEKEFFAKNGLQVQLEQFQDGLQINESVFAGRLDGGGYVALDNIFSAQAASSERGVKIFSFVLEPESKPLLGLLYSNELDINSLEDFSGKKIGYFPPTPPVKLWISEILTKNNVDIEQVQFIPSSPTTIVSALQTKQFDAIFTIEPYTTIAVKQGIGTLFNENESLVAENLGITPLPLAGAIISNDFAERLASLLTKRQNSCRPRLTAKSFDTHRKKHNLNKPHTLP